MPNIVKTYELIAPTEEDSGRLIVELLDNGTCLAISTLHRKLTEENMDMVIDFITENNQYLEDQRRTLR